VRTAAEIHQELARLATLADEQINVTESALLLASLERPRAPWERYHRHLRKLIGEVRAYAGTDPADAGLDLHAEALIQVIAKRYGYRGEDEDEDDPEFANLMRVIDNRQGTPAALGIVYLHVARSLGWPATGIDFPTRFLVRLEHGAAGLILDPAAGGRSLAAQDLRNLLKAATGNDAELTPDHYRPASNRDMLLRLHGDYKLRLLRHERPEDALKAVDAMLLFAPGTPRLWRESGLLNARLERVEAAVASLEEYMRCTPADGARYRASVLLQELRGRLN
jgi:regulator of sirC expression with transglutaminase-like and TPR domain